jgi:hypothetical protein
MNHFDVLEPRKHLAATMPFEAYFPEGYASERINEYVPMTNHNGFEVEYELHARYEFGERDQLVASGRIGANTRGGVTISDVNQAEKIRVRTRSPYALVLKSTAPLAATLSHYDFGTAIGESFTSHTDTQWFFGDGRRDSSLSRDFILVYNPAPTPVTVTLTL